MLGLVYLRKLITLGEALLCHLSHAVIEGGHTATLSAS